MECNKDEAFRSLCLAEQKFLQHDVVGAKKFALKAQSLFPDLDGLPQLIPVLDVHIVAQEKVGGIEMNWYGILQTDAMANDATIRRQYRKLALILHPDKNKAIGAEGAFKLLSEAWRVLSDKDRKAAHDAKRMANSNTFSGFPTMKPTKGFGNFTHFSTWCQPRPGDKRGSFWTGCPSCKMQFEYLRVHENKRISCPACGNFFMATELQTSCHTPSSHPSERASKEAATSWWEKASQTDKDKARSVYAGSSFRSHWGNGRFTAGKQPAAAKTTAEMVHQTYEAVRKERVKAQKEAREKAATERMEAEKEARRREYRDRKQKRKQEQQERQMKVAARASGSSEEIVGMESAHVIDSESRGASCVPEIVERSGRQVSSASSIPLGGLESGPGGFRPSDSAAKEHRLRVRERVSRLDHVQKPFRCRIRNGFESASSYDSSDVFSFSKRLKVDV